MLSRGLIEQAKGRLAERLGISAEEAFAYLTDVSQRTNTRVVDVAADVMGADGGRPDDAPAARRLVQLRAATAAVADVADLLPLLARDGGLDAGAVALFAAEADGALRLVAADGWAARTVADWRWVPSAIRTPAGEAIRRGEPVWLDGMADPGGLTLIGPGPRRAALPLRVDGGIRAALEIVWETAAEFDDGLKQRVSAAAGVAAGWLASAVRSDDAPVAAELSERWLHVVVDAQVVPAAVLTPLWTEDGVVEDFRIDYANAAALGVWGGSPRGRRLLDTDPASLTNGTFDAYARAYESAAEPGVGAARCGPWLVVSWQSDGRERADDLRVATMERLGCFGWGEWSAAGEPLAFSPGLAAILGRPAHRDGVPLDRLLAGAVPEDRDRTDAALKALRQGEEQDFEFRWQGGNARPRAIRVVASTRADHRGGVRAIVALFQDLSEARRHEAEAVSASGRLAAQRMQAAVERAQTEQLRATFFPPPRARQRHGPLTVVARHTAPAGIHRFRGDFYEATAVAGGFVLAVGDVFGSGVQAANAMVRLRHTSRVLALSGLGPAEILTLLNRDLCMDEEPSLASLILARLSADGRSLSWAQAGHFSPLLIRDGRARSLRRPRGDILGLTGEARFTASSVELGEGDLLVMFTDGVLHRWSQDASPTRRLAAECVAAAGAEDLLDRLLPAAEDEACLVAVEWPSARSG
jgi:PAS domain-containing protein